MQPRYMWQGEQVVSGLLNLLYFSDLCGSGRRNEKIRRLENFDGAINFTTCDTLSPAPKISNRCDEVSFSRAVSACGEAHEGL